MGIRDAIRKSLERRRKERAEDRAAGKIIRKKARTAGFQEREKVAIIRAREKERAQPVKRLGIVGAIRSIAAGRPAPVRRAPTRRSPVRRAPMRRAPMRRAPVRRAPTRTAPPQAPSLFSSGGGF